MKPSQPPPPLWVRIFTLALLAALLATPAVMRRFSPDTASAVSSSAPAALARYGFVLTESARESGIDFVHQAPNLDSRLAPIMPEVASMGAAVSIVDFDRDGWDDLYVTNSGEGSKNHLYRNLGNGKFEDVAEKLGIADVNKPGTGVSMGAIWGDFDNDGYEDLFLYKWGRPLLYHNDGGKGFTLVKDAGLPAWVNANSAVWLDYDRDGKLDLLLNGYYDEKLDLWHIPNTRIMPDSFEYATNGGRKYLFHNLGRGRFEDVTAKVGLNSHRWALAAGAADLRGTGYPDIFIANDYGVSEIFANDRGKSFHEIAKQTGVGAAPKSGLNVAFGDVMNQGRFAVYVSNISKEGVLIQGNNLWIPRAGTSGDNLAFDNLAHDMGVEVGGWSFGAQFGDLNNDGTLDLFLTNGYVSLSRDADYWYDFSKVAVGNSSIISDASNWPPVAGRSHSGYEHKRVWINDGAGRFADVAQAVGVTDTHDGRSVATADFENRGALDVVVANQKGPLLLYKNSVNPANHWIEFELEGTKSNRSAIGAEVRCYWSGQQQLQQVSGASGFCAQNSRRLHFGLGKGARIEKVVIRWPSGREQKLESPQLDRLNKVKEPS
jgi:hypothetical protein